MLWFSNEPKPPDRQISFTRSVGGRAPRLLPRRQNIMLTANMQTINEDLI
jgi:hypothetical protein